MRHFGAMPSSVLPMLYMYVPGTPTVQKELNLTEDQQAKQILQDQSQAAAARYSYQLASLKREADNANSDITEIDKKLRKTLDDQKLQRQYKTRVR